MARRKKVREAGRVARKPATTVGGIAIRKGGKRVSRTTAPSVAVDIKQQKAGLAEFLPPKRKKKRK